MASDKLQDITVVESDSDDAGSESSEEFNFAVALALRKNLTETFDKHIHTSNVSDKIACFESKAASSNLPPRPLRNNSRPTPSSTALGVYLRIRPLAAASDATVNVNTLEIQPTQKANDVPTIIRTYPPAVSNAAKVVRTSDSGGGVKEFQFSQVFGPDSSQQDVYSTIAAPLVTGLFPNSPTKSVGESALLFAYGITNAGKTHTIMGDVKDKESNQKWGVIPRALQDIFAHMESSKTAYNLNLSYMEIYNENIFDLLPKEQSSSGQNSAPLELRESSDGQIFVPGLAKHCVKNVAHGLQLAEQAGNKRHTSSNKINSDSSRSHCICQLELVVQTPVQPDTAKDDNEDDRATVQGYAMDEEAPNITRSRDKTVMLWIVDLAGSERSKRTGVVQGSLRQKEAKKINTSLSILMRCLSVMRRNQSLSSTSNVVPFRESKLTHLFKNHLTGPSAKRTVMVVNVNPAEADFDETQHVLAYATAARTVKISQEELHRKRKDMGGGEMEATHDYNGRALKRFKSSKEPVAKPNNFAKLVRHFSPKKLMAKKPVEAEQKKRKIEHKAGESSRSLASEDGEPSKKAARLAIMRAAGKPNKDEASRGSYEKELNSLKTMLSIAQAEAEVLRSEKNELEEQLSQQETLVRMEIAEEMEEQMRVTREQYNGIIDKLKHQVQTNPTPAPKSSKKAQMDKAELYIEELVDKVDECEEEMVRMRQEHAKEVTALQEHHAQVMDAKNQELNDLKSLHAEAIGKLEKTVEDLKAQLKKSSENYSKLEKSKKEMMENYERLFREEDDDEESDDSDDDEEEEDPTPVRRGRQNDTNGTKRLPRSSRRCSKVAVDSVDHESMPSVKKNGHRPRSKRAPFSPVPINENPASEDSDDSFGPDKWLRPGKPVDRDESTGAYLRPRGRAPVGREWDENVGAWRLSEIH